MRTWAETDEFRCPECFGPCEIRVLEQETPDGWMDRVQLRCLECGYEWEQDDP